MDSGFITVFREGEGSYEEKKSRFLAFVYRVRSEEEAAEKLAALRKEHYSARHHCYAYVLRDGVKRYSDDGEPQKTAGVPILEVLEGAGLTDAMIVVVRYFGGTLLGTGGLVRAYTKAAQDGLMHTETVRRFPAVVLEIRLDYGNHGKLQYFLSQHGLVPGDTVFSSDVSVTLPVSEADADHIIEQLTDLFSGNVRVSRGKQLEAGIVNGRMLLFEEE